MSGVLPEFVTFANDLADIAASIIRPLFRKQVPIDIKTDESPVTIADRNTESAMREAIMQRYPDHGIWGEEFGWHNKDAKYCWVLDPIDGTKSFIAGIATFGTLISLCRLGIPVLGVIDQPIQKERWIGDSVQSFFNGTACKVRPCGTIALATFSTTSPYLFGKHKPLFEKIHEQARYTIFGHDCYAYAQLAGGNIDLVIEVGLKPHDFCALRCVIEGAGGIMTDWKGNPLSLASAGDVIAAGDKRVHEEVLRYSA